MSGEYSYCSIPNSTPKNSTNFECAHSRFVLYCVSRGVIVPPDDFMRQSVDAVRASGGVFIADEVQTGFGRLGSSFWAFAQGNHGVVPDIVTIGKPFGNGMALGAVVLSQKIADHFDSMGVEYFNTFGGSPVAAAAGLAVMDVVEDEQLQEHAWKVGDYLKQKFWETQTILIVEPKNICIGDIRGNGLFLGIELVRDRATKEPATAETSFLCTLLKQDYDILTSVDGLHENVLVVKPPMVFSNQDADYFVESFAKASARVNQLTPKELAAITKTPT